MSFSCHELTNKSRPFFVNLNKTKQNLKNNLCVNVLKSKAKKIRDGLQNIHTFEPM